MAPFSDPRPKQVKCLSNSDEIQPYVAYWKQRIAKQRQAQIAVQGDLERFTAWLRELADQLDD